MYVGHAAVCKVETEPNFGRTRTTAVSLYICAHTLALLQQIQVAKVKQGSNTCGAAHHIINK